MTKVSRLLSNLVNIAIASLAIIAIYMFANSYLSSSSVESGNSIRIGEHLDFKGLDFSRDDRTLLIYLSTSCRFCGQSAPFYRAIASLNESNKSVRLVTAFYQKREIAMKFLQEYDIPIREVLTIPESDSPIKSTPAILLVDRSGKVLGSWYGRIKPDEEKNVLNAVFDKADLNLSDLGVR